MKEIDQRELQRGMGEGKEIAEKQASSMLDSSERHRISNKFSNFDMAYITKRDYRRRCELLASAVEARDGRVDGKRDRE